MSSTITIASAPSGIGAPGHDADRLARADRDRGRVPGGEIAHDAQANRGVGSRARGVGRAHRVAVHRGVGEGWHRATGHDIGREHETQRIGSIALDGIEAGHRADHRILHLGERDHDSRSCTSARR